MTKLKTMLLGVALALPLATSGVMGAENGARVAVPPTVEAESSSQICCWVYHMGRWYCVAYC